MADIFLICSPTDERGQRLAESLRQQGWTLSRPPQPLHDPKLRPWDSRDKKALDKERAANAKLNKDATDELLAARCSLVLWSRRSFASGQIRNWASLAAAKPTFLQAVLDSVDEPPREFAHLPWFNLIDWDGTAEGHSLAALKSALAQAIPGSGVALPTPPLPDRKSNRPRGVTTSERSEIPPSGRRIFLCYRRQDTQGHTGRLRDRLVAVYGKDAVFMDVDDVPHGIDFVDYIDGMLSECAVMLVLIGRSWAEIVDNKGRRRLDRADDLVRAEIAGALRGKIPLIPVMVEDAAMPEGEDVPEDIRGLTRRTTVELTHRRWDSDVQQVLKAVERFMGAK